MLKFKSSESIDNGFDIIPISTTKSTDSLPTTIIESEKLSDPIEGFIQLIRQLTKDTAEDLKIFLKATSIWDLLSKPFQQEFALINSNLIHLYFSIPDRVSVVCKFEIDEFFVSKNFLSFTEESLIETLSNGNFDLLERFIFAFEFLEGFALQKLLKIDGLLDCITSDLITELSSSAQKQFIVYLFTNLLDLNLQFSSFCKIIKRFVNNLNLKNDDIVSLFTQNFIKKGSLDYRDISRLLLAVYNENILSNLSLEILKIWSNDSWIFRTPFSAQLHYSSCLMIVFGLMTSDTFTSELEELLMNGVQTRLDHSDSQIRLMATCVAESLNKIHPESENKLDFGLEPSDEVVKHLQECSKLTQIITQSTSFNETRVEINLKTDPLIGGNCSIDSVSEPLDSDDLKPISSLMKEESFTPKNSKTPLPRFLPDCLKLLRSNEDSDLVEKVLKALPETFSASSRLSRQMHAVSAFNTICTLNDHFEIKDFDHIRHVSMQHFLVDQIKIVGPELIECLFKSNKLVLGQKMELLQVVCASAQQVFNSELKKQKMNLIESFSALDYYEQSFLISENHQSSSANSLKSSNCKPAVIKDFLDHLALPLLIQSVRSFQHFKRNHYMFIEKFLWLQAIILNFSQNCLVFDQIVERYLDFVHLALTANNIAISGASSKLVEQIPIQKAILIGVSVVLSSWPSSLPVIQYYTRLQEIYTFLDEVANGPGFSEDQQLQALGSSVAISLQELTDPQKLLNESADQMSLDLKSIKISHLPRLNEEGARK